MYATRIPAPKGARMNPGSVRRAAGVTPGTLPEDSKSRSLRLGKARVQSNDVELCDPRECCFVYGVFGTHECEFTSVLVCGSHETQVGADLKVPSFVM